jgi:hypothetical protein
MKSLLLGEKLPKFLHKGFHCEWQSVEVAYVEARRSYSFFIVLEFRDNLL